MKVAISQRLGRAPGPPGHFLLGNIPDNLRLGQIRFFDENWRRYGDLVRFRLGPYVCHIVVHPDHVRQVLAQNRQNYVKGLGYAKTKDLLGEGLLTNEGAVWQRQRRVMQPAFTVHGVEPFATRIVEATHELLNRWDEILDTGDGTAQTVDVHREMLNLAMRIIGTTMFGVDEGTTIGALVDAYESACAVLNQRLATFLELPHFIPTPLHRRFARAVRTLDRLVSEIVTARRKQPDGHADLLATLLSARDPETGAGMDPRQIRDELVTLFFAGHETSALALCWAWHLLGQHPEVEARLHAELAAVLDDRPPTVADLPHLPYTRMVLEETVRLYPPVWTFPRQAIAADMLSGYPIAAGSLIFPTQYLTHRHPDFWEDPERFDPERFAPERSAGRHPYAYYPFGGGPRTCVGIHFAQLETRLVLATIAQRFRLRPVPGHVVAPTSLITLHPAGGLPMTLSGNRD